ncbi:MAG: ImmA/IrrE family metallo-endopeptidase, partial [Tepidiforma sp.]
GLGDEPIASVIGTAEEHGVVVIGWREGDRFDALSGRAGEAAVIVYNTARSADRVRFTLAHELGHLVMDCASGADAEERLAHRFAGAFLVPRAAVIASLGRNRRSLGIAELGLLKQRWGLSIQGWVRRAFDCGVIDGAVYERLNRTIRARGLHRIEPFPCSFDEIPQLGRRLAWHAVEERLLTREQAASLAPGLEESPEAALSARGTSWRSLAATSAEERARYLAEAPIAVDHAETEAWDAATLDDIEATAEP